MYNQISFIWSISVSVIYLHLSPGSNQGYLSSCVGTFVSSVVISVQVEIHGISAGSIGLSYAIGLGLRVAGVTLSCKYWSIGKCFKLIWTRPFDLASKYATSLLHCNSVVQSDVLQASKQHLLFSNSISTGLQGNVESSGLTYAMPFPVIE